MADVFDFYVYDNRSIVHTSPEPIMQEDKDVAVWRFRIPKVLNNIDMSAWAWWFVYVNAKGQKFSELLTLTNDIDDPENYCTADYSIGYGISKTPGGFTFALEAINTSQGGEISGEWHTRTYTHTVTPTLQGNQAEYAETESDVISALMQEVRNKVNQLVGGATPLPVNLKSQMTDHDKVYLYTGSETGESTGYWYYWNGADYVPGGLYGAGIQIDPTLSQSGQAADAKAVGNELTLIQGYKWKVGYISPDGRIKSDSVTRRYSELIVCPPNALITYKAELHTNVAGISFYDRNKAFIVGHVYTDSENPINSVTSPTNAAYLRLSTTVTLLKDTFVSFESTGMIMLSNRIANYENRANRLIPFVTSGTNRSNLYTDISDILVAEVINDSYDIALQYDSNSTAWSKKIVVSDYSNPTALKLRKSDDSIMPAFSAENVAVALRAKSFVTFGDIIDTLFVSPDGNDNNSGLNRNEPLATIQKAIDLNAKTIIVREGTYSQGFTLDNKNGVNIVIDHYYDTYNAGTDEDNPKITIDGNNTIQDGITVSNCANCNFGNIEVKNMKRRGFFIHRSDNIRFDDCVAHDIGIVPDGVIGGFVILYTNANFYNCVCYNIGTTTAGTGAYHYDGFNIHGAGTTNFFNCKAWNCEDDGISHHDACCGLIDGGEWHDCGKGGIASPTHGAKINISNVYCHNNNYGIYAYNTEAVTDRGNIIFSNCVCKNNNAVDVLVGDYYKVIAINCIYDTASGSENITRFGII